MKIELHEIPIREVAKGYSDTQEDGVIGYDGKLNIRPAFQREFVYNDDQRIEVIRTVMKNFPLNIMYWSVNNDGTFEMLDGQQRTISICQFLNNDFSVDHKNFSTLPRESQERILNYKLSIYFCEGEEGEKLDWFEVVNIVGAKLTKQEMRNSIYTGPWLSDAKLHFSKSNCAAKNFGGDYMKGLPLRQEYLETVLEWIANFQGYKGKPDDKIRDYMKDHQRDADCQEMWTYFQNVINWVKILFPEYRKEMRGIAWGIYYNKYREKNYNPRELNERLKKLLMDYDVKNKSGIYEYLIDGQEKHLNIRRFDAKDARAAYERQNGICAHCGKHFEIDEMEADHITPWSKGGHTEPENCQMLCKSCNRRKGSK